MRIIFWFGRLTHNLVLYIEFPIQLVNRESVKDIGYNHNNDWLVKFCSPIDHQVVGVRGQSQSRAAADETEADIQPIFSD